MLTLYTLETPHTDPGALGAAVTGVDDDMLIYLLNPVLALTAAMCLGEVVPGIQVGEARFATDELLMQEREK